MTHALRKRCRNWFAVSSILSLLALACTQPQPDDNDTAGGTEPPPVSLSDSVFGVVSTRNDTTCLGVASKSWQPSDSVLIIEPGDQRAIKASMREALPRCSEVESSPDVRYFRLEAPDFRPGNLGIALLVSPMPAVNGARTDLDGDGTPESYRSCTSGEGVHLTAWAGEPLTGRRVWHYYHYLGYDTEPTCVEVDYIER